MKVTTIIMEFAATASLSETRFLLPMELGLIGLDPNTMGPLQNSHWFVFPAPHHF